VSISRTGSVASGTVTISSTLPSDPAFAGGSSTSEVFIFNSNGLVTSDSLSLKESGSSPATTSTTSYQYQPNIGRYNNGAPSWAQVVLMTNPDGSWVGYQYSLSTGWITQMITPFESSTWTPPEAPGDPTDTSADDVEA
jgi:hypothetical protein